jgi:hypothetical protein
MATVDELAHRIYPGMASSGSSSQAASSPAPRSELGEIARRLYPSMKSSSAPPSQTTERAGFYKRVLTCDMTGPMKGRLRYVDVPVSRTL